MATDEQIIAALQDKVATLSGIKAAPDQPPESINQYPFAACWMGRFAASGGPAPGMVKTLGTLICQIHVARVNLPTNLAQASPYGRLFRRLVWNDPYLLDSGSSRTVDTILAVRGTFGYLGWAGAANVSLGWEFEVDFKVEETTA